MHGKPNGPISLAAAQALRSLYDTYDMNKHTQDDSGQAAGLRATFVDHFGIVGPLDICIEKLHSLAALGLDKRFFGVMFRLVQTPEGRVAKVLIEREILPALR
jgi:cation transport regulator ChaC